MARFTHMISTVDAHTAGEPVRLVLSGLPPVLGKTMVEKKHYVRNHLDHFRTLLMQEPRGHADMFGAILTAPCNEAAQYGVLFMDNGGYLDMCGHSIMGVTTALIEIGMVPAQEPETTLVFETPAGLITSRARVEEHCVTEVSIVNVPAFLYAENVEIEIPSFGRVVCDVAFGGNFFATLPVKSLGLSLSADHIPALIRLGIEIKRAINARLAIRHPLHEHMDTVELTEFYERPDPSIPFAKNLVVFGAGQCDRCPCGTGTSATLAALYAKGELSLDTEFVTESIIGTRFKGRLTRTIELGGFMAVEPIITGTAYLMGMHQFWVDPQDPVKFGFKVHEQVGSMGCGESGLR